MSFIEMCFVVVMLVAILLNGYTGFGPNGNRIYAGGGFLLWLAVALLG